MYGKIFASIFDSTLIAEGGWLPTYIFMSMVSLADKNGLVEIAEKALFRRLGFREYDSKIEYSEFQNALTYLESADPNSRSIKHDGKRIIKLAEIPEFDGNRGWIIVNYDEYRKKASRVEPSGTSTQRVQKFRATNKINDLENGNGNETACNGRNANGNGHTDTDTDTDTDKTLNHMSKLDFREFWARYPRKQSKKKAEQTWIRLSAGKKKLALLDLKTRFLTTEIRFVPLPTSYLNAERWDDEPINEKGISRDEKTGFGQGDSIGTDWLNTQRPIR
jgi:hypothetical protein